MAVTYELEISNKLGELKALLDKDQDFLTERSDVHNLSNLKVYYDGTHVIDIEPDVYMADGTDEIGEIAITGLKINKAKLTVHGDSSGPFNWRFSEAPGDLEEYISSILNKIREFYEGRRPI